MIGLYPQLLMENTALEQCMTVPLLHRLTFYSFWERKGSGECTPSLVPDSLLTIHFHKENEEICFTWLVPPPDDWSPQPSHQQILIYEVVVYSLEEPIFPSSA